MNNTGTASLFMVDNILPNPSPSPSEQRDSGRLKAKTRMRTIAVTSGKGGVGKTNFVVNVSIALAALGRAVTLLDADLALANADVLLGINPPFHIGHVLSGERQLNDVIVNSRGVRFIPGSSGLDELANLPRTSNERLVAELEAMERDSDFMLIDTAAGIGGNVIGVLCAASEVVVMTMPEPTALVDAYATIKVLHRYAPTKPIWIVVNNVVGVRDAEEIFNQLRTVSQRFLSHKVEYLGAIPRDADLSLAVREQRPVIEYAPSCPASRSIRLIAKYLEGSQPFEDHGVRSFWRALAQQEQ